MSNSYTATPMHHANGQSLVNRSGHRPDGARPRLLLVDDDSKLCRTLSAGLDARGFDVEVAGSAREAALRMNSIAPRYAVLALRLPDGSGLRLISQLSRLFPSPRIVVLTAYPSIRTAVEAIKLGAADYLAKPSSIDDIIAALSHDIGDHAAPVEDKTMTVHRATWEYISHVLHQNDGNISATARTLSIDRRTLQRKLRKRADSASSISASSG